MRLLPALLILAPALAGAQAAPRAGSAADPDRQVAGGLKVPGWTAHFDRPGATANAVTFVPMGTGYHVVAGPAAIYFDPTKTASGAYTVRASFTQTKAPAHPEAYGLIVGGQNLAGDDARYLYFIVRGDGKYAIKQRAGANDVRSLADWTASPALHAADAAGKATNVLRVQVAADSVRFYANDRTVVALASSTTGPLAGVAGFRVNHNLDVHVDNFSVAPSGARSASARPAR